MQFQNNYYYHVFNRGVDRRNVFLDDKDFLRFLVAMRVFNSIDPVGSLKDALKMNIKNKVNKNQKFNIDSENKLVSIIAYCLNPNHFHILLKQIADNGISKFMMRLGGYTKYFNIRHKRSGSLFEARFKAVPVKTNGRFLQTALYINGNHEIHGLGKADNWPWSSCLDYLGRRNGTLCDKDLVMESFLGVDDFFELLKDYVSEKKEWKKEEMMLES